MVEKTVEKGNKLGWGTNIKQPNPKDYIKDDIAKYHLYFFFMSLQKSGSLLQIIILLYFDKCHISYDSGIQGSSFRKQKAEKLDEKQYNNR